MEAQVPMQNKECRAEKPWAVSCVAALVAMLLAGLVCPMCFGTNDDAYVLQALSGGGGVSASPTPYVSFINYGLCWVISSLYGVVPEIPWWVLLHLASIFFAVTAANRVVVALRGLRERNAFVRLAALAALDFGLFSYFLVRLQFTTTSSLLMAAAILLSCGLGEQKARCGMGTRVIVPVLMGVVGYAMRPQSGYLGFFFWILAVLPRLFKGGSLKERVLSARFALLPLVIAGSASLALLGLHAIAYSRPDLTASRAYASALAHFTDYPTSSFEENPELYESVGWDEELTSLVGRWFLMDERVNAESLAAVDEGIFPAIRNLLENPVATLKVRLSEFRNPLPMAYASLLVLAGVGALMCVKRREERAVVWLITASAIILMGYLVIRGRFPARAMYAILLPALASLVAMMLESDGRAHGRRSSRADAVYLLCSALACGVFVVIARELGKLPALLTLVVVILMFFSFWRSGSWRLAGALSLLVPVLMVLPGAFTVVSCGGFTENAASIQESRANAESFYDYCREHSDQVFIAGGGATLYVQSVWDTEWARNQTGWGGWRYPYDWYAEAMREVGLDGQPMSSDLLREDVLYVDGSDGVDETFLSYMEGLYGPLEIIRVDELDGGIAVYRFVPIGA